MMDRVCRALGRNWVFIPRQVGALSRGLEGPDVSSHMLPLAAAGGIAGRRLGLKLRARPR